MMKYLKICLLAYSFCLWSGEQLHRFASSQGVKPKIAIVTDLSDRRHNDMFDNCTQTKIEYCKKHGYDLILSDEALTTCFDLAPLFQRDLSWNKIALVSKHINNYDWVVYMAPQAIVTNDKVPLERFIDDAHDFVGAIAVNVHTPTDRKNTRKNPFITDEVWFLRNSQPAKTFLRCIWKTGLDAFNAKRPSNAPHQMQSVLAALCGQQAKFTLGWKSHPQSEFCSSMATYRKGDFVLCVDRNNQRGIAKAKGLLQFINRGK